MAYNNDPVAERHIVRESLISSATRLYQHLPPDPQLIIATCKMWEAYVYEDDAKVVAPAHTNGVTPVSIAPPSLPTWLCAQCGNPLTAVTFKKGTAWTVEELARRSQEKFGKVLCKSDYFGKKTA